MKRILFAILISIFFTSNALAVEPGILGLRWGMTKSECKETLKKYYSTHNLKFINERDTIIKVTGINNSDIIKLSFPSDNVLSVITIERENYYKHESGIDILEDFENSGKFKLIDLEVYPSGWNRKKMISDSTLIIVMKFMEGNKKNVDIIIADIKRKNEVQKKSVYFPLR